MVTKIFSNQKLKRINTESSPMAIKESNDTKAFYFNNTDLQAEDDENESFLNPPKYLEKDGKNLKFKKSNIHLNLKSHSALKS